MGCRSAAVVATYCLLLLLQYPRQNDSSCGTVTLTTASATAVVPITRAKQVLSIEPTLKKTAVTHFTKFTGKLVTIAADTQFCC